MRRICCAVVAAALLASASNADAHGIAGNRYFIGTLTFDDPSVADEAVLPNFSTLTGPVTGGNATDNRFDWSFTRLLTPYFQVQVDSGWIHRNWSTARTSGFDTTDVGIKSEVYRNNSMKFWCRRVYCGALGTPERRVSALTNQTLFNRVSSSGKALVTCLMASAGFALLRSAAHS
jgi:opacity protein-like surface antigen